MTSITEGAQQQKEQSQLCLGVLFAYFGVHNILHKKDLDAQFKKFLMAKIASLLLAKAWMSANWAAVHFIIARLSRKTFAGFSNCWCCLMKQFTQFKKFVQFIEYTDLNQEWKINLVDIFEIFIEIFNFLNICFFW